MFLISRTNTVDVEVETGYCTCVGMVGATLGGGIGPLQGLHGLIIDALVSVRVVTAANGIVVASASENIELFWALRGAGANFGIVTSATYRIHNFTNNGNVLTTDLKFAAAKNATVFEVLHALARNQTPSFAVTYSIQWSLDFGEVRCCGLKSLRQ
jgi:FAD/FMN-containing dehydrogenase